MPGAAKAPGKPTEPGRSPHQSHADEDYCKPDCCLSDIHRRRVITVTMTTMIMTMKSTRAMGPEIPTDAEFPPAANHSCAM